jgi:hypothetical protein
MSGGAFDYLQTRFEWDDAIERIADQIAHNPYEFDEKTINEFREGLLIIKKSRIYLQRIDWLLSGDDGEESFHERLKEDLTEFPTS